MRDINKIHLDVMKKRLHNEISVKTYETLLRAIYKYERRVQQQKLQPQIVGGEDK